MKNETCSVCHNSPCTCGTSKQKMIFIIMSAIVLIIAGLGVYRFNFTNDDIYLQGKDGTIMKYDDMQKGEKGSDAHIMTGSETMMKKDTMMSSGTWTKEEMDAMKKDHMMMSGSDTMMKPESPKMEAMQKSHGYMNYSTGLVTSALKSGQNVVLFFHASWCPSCKALDANIQSDLGSIPTDTLILKVDYDSSTDLKKQYGVTTQHTIITLNNDGSIKSKKIGSQTVGEIIGK